MTEYPKLVLHSFAQLLSDTTNLAILLVKSEFMVEA